MASNIRSGVSMITPEQRKQFFYSEGWYADDETILGWLERVG